MRLGDFIRSNMEPILQAWEEFASTLVPPALTMDSKALRDHARYMLEAIALDLSKDQTEAQQFIKSTGAAPRKAGATAAETHASERLLSGFSIEQLFSEYRALRASVLRLWSKESKTELDTDPEDMMRFNEAIDQAVAESVGRYAKMVARSQNLFLAILGHDLRNPLATTIMASSFIMQSTEAHSKLVTAASRIYSAGNRMNKLVNDLIDYTRTHLGSKLPILVKEIDMHVLARDTVAEHEIAHPERTFRLEANGNFKGQWDDSRIAQVLSNLLGNAVQYGSTESPITVRLWAEADDVHLTVENHGAVIEPQKMTSLFEPLVRFAKGDDEPQGRSLGIGLYIAREIVYAHGGEIRVTSSEAEGTVFAVTLPRTPPAGTDVVAFLDPHATVLPPQYP